MTREEAIKWLSRIEDKYIHGGDDDFDAKRKQALEMAIEALKQVTGKLNNPDDSLLTADSEACKEQKSKLDLISRAEAIEHFMRLSEDESLTPYTQMLMVGVLNEIKKLPSADRPRGRWHYSDGKPATIGQSFGVICDQCGTESEYCTNFCDQCGADMRGESEE